MLIALCFKYLPSKLLTSTGFSRKIFFFLIFLVGESLVKKLAMSIKSGFMKYQNQNFDFTLQNPPTKFVSKLPAGLLTSTGRYIYLLKIMPSREQEMKRSKYILFVKQYGDMYKSVTAWKKINKNFSRVSIIFLK